MEEKHFETYAIVELFGHQKIAGMVTEQTIAGQGFIRVDVPSVNDQPGYTRLFGSNAIYSIIPCSEEIAKGYCAYNSSKPVQIYELRLPEPGPDDGDDDVNRRY